MSAMASGLRRALCLARDGAAHTGPLDLSAGGRYASAGAQVNQSATGAGRGHFPQSGKASW